MFQTSQTRSGTQSVRPRGRPGGVRRAVFEALDARTMMCAVPHGPQAAGATVAWAAAAITAADMAANEAGHTGNSVSADGQTAALAAPRAVAAPAPIRINAGGPAYRDPAGTYWSGDAYHAGGTASQAGYPVANTGSDPLYYARRWGGFNYNIPVAAPGTYSLRLHFADPLYTTAGNRSFSVRAENNTVLSNFDVAQSGGGRAAVVRSFAVTVNDGTLNLNFVKGARENPIVSAIEVVPQNTSAPPAAGNVAVAGLTLINAATDAPIGAFSNGATLDTSGGRTYSVRADVGGGVRSVRFLLDGRQVRVENAAPYAVNGDAGGDYPAWNVPAGNHTLTVVPYSGTGATGTAGPAFNVNFAVRSTTPTPPPPNPTPPPPPTSGGAFTNINYATKASNPIARAEALAATWNGRLYTFGGFSGSLGPVTRSDAYNPAANSWAPVAPLPQRITHAGVAQDGQNVYMIGGYIGHAGQTGYGQTFGSNRVWRYNFASNSYAAMPNLPRALSGGGAAIVGRNLHYFGGQEANRGDTTVHLVLNLDNPSAGWQGRRSMTFGRSHFAAAAVGGKLYAIAGQTGNDGGLVTRRFVEVYDPATDQWTNKTQIPKAVSHVSSATFVMNGRILIMGGESSHNAQVRDVFAYNPGTDGWAALTPLPAARFSGAAGTISGKIYFSTGGSGATTWEGTPA